MDPGATIPTFRGDRTSLAGLLCLWGVLMTGWVGEARAGWNPADWLGGRKPTLNVYRAAPELPADLRRVAVLPLHGPGSDLAPETRRNLEEALFTELLRSRFAEIVPVSDRQLRKLTGRETWTACEVLPEGFLEKLRQATEADAVLFVEVTAFRAYTPAVVGWRMRLVDLRSGCTWWAADELFDTADPSVVRAAQRFERTAGARAGGGSDGWRSLRAPGMLARMTVACLLATLPGREISR
jgi:hypothetical protein